MTEILERLDRIDAKLAELLDAPKLKRTYTTAEVGAIVGRAPYTCREWARQGRIPAVKAPNGRGWLVSHETLEAIQAGELPAGLLCPRCKEPADRLLPSGICGNCEQDAHGR